MEVRPTACEQAASAGRSTSTASSRVSSARCSIAISAGARCAEEAHRRPSSQPAAFAAPRGGPASRTVTRRGGDALGMVQRAVAVAAVAVVGVWFGVSMTGRSRVNRLPAQVSARSERGRRLRRTLRLAGAARRGRNRWCSSSRAAVSQPGHDPLSSRRRFAYHESRCTRRSPRTAEHSTTPTA